MNNTEKFNYWLDNNIIFQSAYNNLVGKTSNRECNDVHHNERKISVIISTHNRSQLLLRLLDSILHQNYTNYEIIIVDDKSSDDTKEVVHNYIDDHSDTDITYYCNEKNRGVSYSKKKGYLLCSGDVIIFSDDDDYYIDDYYFAKVNDVYANHPDCTMTIAGTLFHYDSDDSYHFEKLNYPGPVENKDFINGFCSEYNKPGSMFTLTIDAKKSRNIHYEELQCFNDMSLYLYGALAKGKIYPITEAVGVYSVQTSSMSSSVSADFIINNLNAKAEIGKKAMAKGYIEKKDYSNWLYKQSLPTLMLFYNCDINSFREYIQVNNWVFKNLKFPFRHRIILRGIKARIIK